MIKLIIEDDEGKTTVVPLIRDEISIGRKEGNTIRLTERNVSRRHARLLKNNGTVFIEDLDSYNGIKVNGNKIAGRVAITEGDRIQIGDYVLGLKLEGSVAAERAPEDAVTKKLPEAGITSAISDVAASSEERTKPIPVVSPDGDPTIEQVQVARLVCVSVNFARTEFTLNKPVMVLGRTDDNDIIINHRSISRHHCRVIEENGRYTIVDLQSANGVRVNGEDYGKVELRKGDLIDLGHVRLRFVAPGEDFDFERDATVVNTAELSGGPSGVWLGVAVVALIAIGVVVWKVLSPAPGGDLPPDLGTAAKREASVAVPAVDTAKIVASINSAIDSEEWDQALEQCNKLEGQAQTATVACEKAQQEKQWKKTFEDAISKTTQLAWVEALQLFNRIPNESIYSKKRNANPEFEEARTKYLAGMLPTIAGHAAKGECDEANAKASAVRILLPTDTEATAAAAKCRAIATNTKTKRPPRTPRTPKVTTKTKTVRPTKKGPTEAERAQAKAWLKQARTAYVGGHHAQAIKVARKVLRILPKSLHALQIIGSSACYTNNVSLAKQSYRRLDVPNRRLLRSVCNRKGISLD